MTERDERKASIKAGLRALEALTDYINAEVRCLEMGAIQDIFRTMGLIRGDIIENRKMLKYEAQP